MIVRFLGPALALAGLVWLAGCGVLGGVGSVRSNATSEDLPMDAHSSSRPNEVRVRHLALELRADFTARTLRGAATLHLERRDQSAPLVVDTKDLRILAVTGTDGSARECSRGAADAILGQALTIPLQGADTSVRIEYETSPGAEALQWLAAEQTEGRKLGFLYTQGQAILTRSWIPIQDTPGVRITYEARITAPAPMRVVMSAATRREEGAGVFSFRMEKAIPCYLIAMACGDIARKDISERCAVFADPAILDRAAAEFEDTETMLAKCEATFGPYGWGRYDILVLPPAFPFGGMENPTLTFATPTIITGDKSLVALIAHEMAHSWSGNLVTNATWRDFWLNEGFTVFLEQRVMELVYGRERAEVEIATGMRGLRREMADLPPVDQVLHIDLTGRNPDDAMTAIAYDKGATFLRRLEQVFGRPAFDRFLADYFAAHAFRSITTAEFLAYLDEHLLQSDPAKAAAVDVHAWVHEPGLPDTVPPERADLFEAVDRYRDTLRAGQPDATLVRASWTTHHWLYLIESLPEDMRDPAALARLDDGHGFAKHANPELRCAFLTLAMRTADERFVDAARTFLLSVGRRKFLAPIFRSLVLTERGRELAREILREASPRLHSITRNSLQKIVDG